MTTVSDQLIRLSPTIDMIIDYHIDMPEDKATLTAFRVQDFIKWAFNNKEVVAMFSEHSPRPTIVKVDNIDDLPVEGVEQ